MAKPFADATGRLARFVPESAGRNELLGLVRLGVKFRAQHVGRRPDYLTQYLLGLVRTLPQPVTFAELLDALELEAARREIHGETVSPTEKVNRIWSLVTIHHPKRGRVQIPFKSLQNKLTTVRKIIRIEKIPVTPKPGMSLRTLSPEACAHRAATEGVEKCTTSQKLYDSSKTRVKAGTNSRRRNLRA